MSYVLGSVLANATATLLQQQSGDGEKLYLSFSHDNDILHYLTGLGLFDDEPQMDVKEIDFKRSFKTGELVPLGARLLTERLSCTSSSGETETFVRLVLNDQVYPIPGCTDGPGFSCPLNDYVELTSSHIVDYKEACDADSDAPNYVSFYWDWAVADYPSVADEE
ncbi:unnamed protein product [Ambrosiozyma monospora]|uniref:Unnamed protein product n=1 Tax=Ambrosiozyma monospora TaxID=43982 RepID=A0ACB5UE04_AMBMO|nr:unnamed protein product [Ambrosiozyma monospora]